MPKTPSGPSALGHAEGAQDPLAWATLLVRFRVDDGVVFSARTDDPEALTARLTRLLHELLEAPSAIREACGLSATEDPGW